MVSTRKTNDDYCSQNMSECSIWNDVVCGIVTLSNAHAHAMRINFDIEVKPMFLISMALDMFNDKSHGLALKQLVIIIERLGMYDVEINRAHIKNVRPGDIIIVDSVALKNEHSNIQSLCTFEQSHNDLDVGHYVVIEKIHKHQINIINPDTRPTDSCPCVDTQPCSCYVDGQWGRMSIRKKQFQTILQCPVFLRLNAKKKMST